MITSSKKGLGTSRSEGGEAFLTVARIRDMKYSYETTLRSIGELQKKAARLKELLDAAMMFVPSGFKLDEAATPPAKTKRAVRKTAAPRRVLKPQVKQPELRLVSSGGLSWTEGMDRALRRLNRGVTHAELREELKKGELADREPWSDKSFYGAIVKLMARKKLGKEKGLLYARSVLDDLLSRGAALPHAPSVRPGGDTAANLVLELLKANPSGFTGPELKERITRDQRAPESVRKHDQYIYNVLAGLSPDVVKKNGRYVLNAEKSETPQERGLVAHAS